MPIITPRSEWGADRGPGPAITVPTSRLFIHHTVTFGDPFVPSTVAMEKAQMRFLEVVRGFSIGVPYSFCVFGTGRIYEGQGWGREGAHTCNDDDPPVCWNRTAHGFAFVANHDIHRLPDPAREAMRWLIEEGIRRGKLTPGVQIDPHRAVKATACPGRHVLPHMEFFREGGDDDVSMTEYLDGDELARQEPNRPKPPSGSSRAFKAGFNHRRLHQARHNHDARYAPKGHEHEGGGGTTHDHPTPAGRTGTGG